MKTITIVAIIAAVAIVGAACIGIPLSGVLNGDTSGNTPVKPTDTPVEPTPTETPIETPTPTPTSTPMSYFSGGGSKSDSGGGSSSNPDECPKGGDHEWVYSPIDGNKHSKVCGKCNTPTEGGECVIVLKYNEGSTPATHNTTCVTCGRDEGETQCTIEAVHDGEGKETHSIKCIDNCGYQEATGVTCTVTYQHVENTETHSGSCSACGESYTKECSFTLDLDNAKYICNTCYYEKPIMASIGEGDEITYYSSVSDAINVAGDKEVKLLRDMTSEVTIGNGKSVTINPNGKNTALTYESVSDIKIKNNLGTASLVNVTNVDGEKLRVTFSETPDAAGLLVVKYAKGEMEMHIYTVEGLNTETINEMPEKSTIVIKTGEYQPIETIVIKKSMTIIGEGSLNTIMNNCVFDVYGADSENAMDVTFENLKFVGTSRIIVGTDSDAIGGDLYSAVGDLTVRNCYAKTTFTSDSLTAGKGQFIYLRPTYSFAINLTLTGNTLINAHTISGEDASPVVNGNGLVINKVEITGNTFGDSENPCDRYAVKFARRTTGTTIEISGNTVYGATTTEKDFAILDLWQSGSNRGDDLSITVTNNNIIGIPDAGRTMYVAYVEATVQGTGFSLTASGNTLNNVDYNSVDNRFTVLSS